MTEEKKTKGKGCLIALGAAAVLVVLFYMGVMFFLNRAQTVVEEFAGSMGVAPEMIEEVKTLNKEYGFTPPPNNRITENQVQTFIKIKKDFAGDIKRHEEEFKALEDRTEGREAGFKEFSESLKILGNIRRDFLNSLKHNQMSPREYKYLTEQIYSNYFAAAVQESYVQMSEGMESTQESYQQQMAQFEQQLNDPNLSDDQRETIKTAMENYKNMMQQMQTGVSEMGKQLEKMPRENIEVLNEYREELQELNTLGFEFWGLALTVAD